MTAFNILNNIELRAEKNWVLTYNLKSFTLPENSDSSRFLNTALYSMAIESAMCKDGEIGLSDYSTTPNTA